MHGFVGSCTGAPPFSTGDGFSFCGHVELDIVLPTGIEKV